MEHCGVPSVVAKKSLPTGGDETTSIRTAFYEAVNNVDRAVPPVSRSLRDITTDCTHRRSPFAAWTMSPAEGIVTASNVGLIGMGTSAAQTLLTGASR
jgi:hypothetical protein